MFRCVKFLVWLISYHIWLQGTLSSWSQTRWDVGLDVVLNNKTWILVWGFWLLGGWTTKTKVWSNIWIKNAKNLFNKNFQNFDVSDKKSADFSCLFTFFQKNCESKIFLTTFWELHNWQFWIAICLHFWNQLIYVLIQKSKQITNSSCQLCNSQNVVKSIMNLQFFWKM